MQHCVSGRNNFGRAAQMIGVDEAGRGPLAGPVCAAAVVLPPEARTWRLADSKVTSKARRLELARRVESQALAFGLGWASVEEIDSLNILQATCLAMFRAVTACRATPLVWDDMSVMVDGSVNPARYLASGSWVWPTQTVVRGDATISAISAASILAKVHRDAAMAALDLEYPGYGFGQHAGYGTAQHLAALDRLGVCAAHRKSFAPVSRRLR
ncbi:MAG: ribonuclease HII [Betaproteobacteria bacterium]|nr:ribonuclease HII [Betaproteobacteria bacterium]NBT74503.1 ribonuclease HII [Betaproteobacteria bacterium]